MPNYPPECPFCKRDIERPQLIRTEFGEVLRGVCKCGSVYVCDPTGHNAGEAYMEALALMKGGWDIDSLDPDSDYEVADMVYDLKAHTRIYHKGQAVRGGVLIFVKGRVKGSSSPTEQQGALNSPEHAPSEKRDKGVRPKSRVRALLEVRAFDEIVRLSLQDKSIIRTLISLTYDKEDVITWRAIEAFGHLSRGRSKEQSGPIRDTVRRLIWSMSDECGAIGWSAPEILGEIIRNNPEDFSDIVPIVWSFREEHLFKESVLWAMGRIAEVRPDLVAFAGDEVAQMVRDTSPATRAYAARVMGYLGKVIPQEELRMLLRDDTALRVYRDGSLIDTTVAEMARRR